MQHMVLVAGLVIFLGSHLFLVLGRARVDSLKASLGDNTWKAVHSVISIIGLGLIIYGFGLSRMDPVFIWNPPLWTRHVAAMLSVIAMIFLVAAYVPANHIKARLGHPMYLAIKTWALAHLLANGRLGDMLLFGTFLVWAIIGFSNNRRHDRQTGKTFSAGTMQGTVITVVVGLAVSALIVLWLHTLLIGVPVA